MRKGLPDPTLRLNSLFWPYPIKITPKANGSGATFEVPLFEYKFKSLPGDWTFKLTWDPEFTPFAKPNKPWGDPGSLQWHLTGPGLLAGC